MKYAPGIERSMLECNDEERDIVDLALEYGCKRVQHQYSERLQDIIKKADENGIISNLFYEDNPKSALDMVGKGIDTILTNYADRIMAALKKQL
jgi:GTP cyclohydrolase FolE2